MQQSRQMIVGAVAAVALAGAATTRAASDTWVAGTDGNYNVPANWVGTNVPNGAADVATIEGAGSVVGFADTVTLADLALAQSVSGGSPVFNQTGGTLTLNRLLFGGGGGSRNPTYNLTAGTLDIATAFTWGNGNNARFNYGGTGTVNYAGTGFFSLGVAGGANGGIVGSGDGVFNANGVTALRLGSSNGGTGSISLSDDAVFNATANGTFYLGNNGGSGSLSLADASQFNAPNLVLSVGQFGNTAGNKGSVTMTGGTLRVARIALGGDNATSSIIGTLDLNGGTIETGQIKKGSSSVAADATANYVSANGGTIRATANDGNASFFDGAFVTLGANGLAFDTNGNDVTINNDMTGTGGLTKLGAGTLSLTGPNTYGGTTTVGAGTLRLGTADALADAGGVVLAGGTLVADGESDLIGSLDVTAASTLRFGEADTTPHALTFAAAGAGTGPLSVTNWSGGVDQFLFASESAAASIAALTTFVDPSGGTGSIGATVVASGGNFAVVPVPEPAGLALLGVGAAGLLLRRRRTT